MTQDMMRDGAAWRRLTAAVVECWPDHARFLEKSAADLDTAERSAADALAGSILRLFAEDEIPDLVGHYRWTCERLLEEELHFRRTGRYRRESFAAAKAEVYDDSDFMVPYIDGLLLSQVLWSNHARVFALYRGSFLPGNPRDYRHLEVGPGHGLWLAAAAADPHCAEASAWDTSADSLAATRRSLDRLGVERPVHLEQADVLAGPIRDARFNSVVISEVLEHLEDPAGALARLFAVMAPGGRLFVNMPINSPAPDHIYLLTEPEQVGALVEDAGFRIVEQGNYPASGYSEERARKIQATISCAVIAAKPG